MSSIGNKPMLGSNSLSGSEEEEKKKKRRRKESNRESARRSRQRKQRHLDDLVKDVGRLTKENEDSASKIGELTRCFGVVEGQNAVLRAEKQMLARRLDSLRGVAEMARATMVGVGEENGSMDCDTVGNFMLCEPGMMVKPWQLPCPSMPLLASSATRFHF